MPTLAKSDTLFVKSGGKNFITPLNLTVNSPGIADTALKFIITSLPKNGVILRRTDTLKIGQFFTQAEIKAGLINYLHTNKNSIQDIFGYILSNGAGGFIPLNFLHIKIDNSVNTTTLAPSLTCTIFPNPSAGLIQVEWDFLFKREALLEIHDLSGKLIFKQLCPSFQQNIQIDGTLWEKGTYVLTIQGEQQRISTLFIIN